MFIAELSKITNRCKQLKCIPTDKWINKNIQIISYSVVNWIKLLNILYHAEAFKMVCYMTQGSHKRSHVDDYVYVKGPEQVDLQASAGGGQDKKEDNEKLGLSEVLKMMSIA